MLKRLRSRLHGEDGFTLIELLVVILIIGILAAIAIPSFLSQKSKGEDAETKSAARTAQTAMETYYTDNGTYVGATAAKLREIENSLPAEADIAVTGLAGGATVPTANQWRVEINGGDRDFAIEKDAGAVTRECDVVSRSDPGGCKLAADPATTGTW